MEYHVAQLEALGRFLDKKKQDILEATALDMGKPPFEVELSKMSICRSELNHTLNNLGTWMKDEHVEKNWAMRLDLAFITRTRMGLCSSSPWNYPINLLLVTLIGTMPWSLPCQGDRTSSSNCVVMKLSKISRNVERLVAEMLPSATLPTLSQDCFAMVTASVEEPTRLLESKFDYIFFTGTSHRDVPVPSLSSRQGDRRSPSVGRIVMAAAAKRLTPVTLELGGKNPCYVSDTCDVQNVARRVAWGRFFNAGQTCVAPDYVLCSAEMREKLLPALHEVIAEFYRPDPQESPDFTHIMGYKQFQRVQALLRSGDVAIKGQTDTEARLGSPTVLVDVQQDEPVMQEDIFRPILPVFTVASVDDTIAFINARERLLAICVFSSYKKVRSWAGSSIPLSLGHILLRGSGSREEADKGCPVGAKHPPALTPQVVNRVLERTSSGCFCSNDTITHMTLTSLPIGGIGRSVPRKRVLQNPPAPSASKARGLPAAGEPCPEPFWLCHHPPPRPQQLPAAPGLSSQRWS
ncbi:hypothetical protein QYF61_019956 [Mycteria americana]|uniref:Aldehyde dehydrogenase n=1 Tax=Mycteria americana TaxID=33587 RepID=A0AAN7NBJ8_MYCAM|nr:hypothetical protein QYF61_019956 [Mycteria americana]